MSRSNEQQLFCLCEIAYQEAQVFDSVACQCPSSFFEWQKIRPLGDVAPLILIETHFFCGSCGTAKKRAANKIYIPRLVLV